MAATKSGEEEIEMVATELQEPRKVEALGRGRGQEGPSWGALVIHLSVHGFFLEMLSQENLLGS